MTSQIIIPARLASTRLPRKLLLAETGKPLIQHTYESARRARRPAGICVATDHEDIYQAVQAFGGRAEMTDPHAASGTDRVAEVARRMPDAEIIVNVQGDEPEIAGSSIDLAIELLEAHPEALMSTLATPIRNRRQLEDPACVKVVFDRAGQGPVFQPQPHPAGPRVGRRPAGGRPAALLPARGAVRLSPRIPLETRRHAAFQPGEGGEARTTPRPASGLLDSRGRGR